MQLMIVWLGGIMWKGLIFIRRIGTHFSERKVRDIEPNNLAVSVEDCRPNTQQIGVFLMTLRLGLQCIIPYYYLLIHEQYYL